MEMDLVCVLLLNSMTQDPLWLRNGIYWQYLKNAIAFVSGCTTASGQCQSRVLLNKTYQESVKAEKVAS